MLGSISISVALVCESAVLTIRHSVQKQEAATAFNSILSRGGSIERFESLFIRKST